MREALGQFGFQATNPFLATEAEAALARLEAVAEAAQELVDSMFVSDGDPQGKALVAALRALDEEPA